MIPALPLLLALAQTAGAQEGAGAWKHASVVDGMKVEIDVKSIREKRPLRFAVSRWSAPGSPRTMIMSFAVECKAKTVAIAAGEVLYYDGGRLDYKETVPPEEQVQENPNDTPGMLDVVTTICGS